MCKIILIFNIHKYRHNCAQSQKARMQFDDDLHVIFIVLYIPLVCGPSRFLVYRWRTKASSRRSDAICIYEKREREREILKRKRQKLRVILADRCSSKFRLIASPTAPAHLHSKDAFRCRNIPGVSIPTGISIHRSPDIIVRPVASTFHDSVPLLLDGRIRSYSKRAHYAFSNLLFSYLLRARYTASAFHRVYALCIL